MTTTAQPLPWLLAAALATTLSGPQPLRAQEAGSDESELEALTELLAEETEVATTSRQNADYVPGIVSVLHGDEAALLGARSVLDALALVPGIEINRDERGSATPRVRGVDFFFNGGNVKVMVDSLAISRETAFQNSGILLMPIEQVERIEVIRGPGAGIHGDFAFVGLVNIITRHHDNAIALSAGSGGRRSGVWNFSADNDTGLHVDGSFSNWRSDRFDAPGERPGDEDRRYASVALSFRGFSFKAAAVDRYSFRLNPAPPPAPPGALERLLHDERNVISELRYGWERDEDSRSAVWFNFQDANMQRGFAGFRGQRWELGGDSTWRWGEHRLLVQVTFAQPGIDHAFDFPNRPGAVRTEVRGDRRDYLTLTLQDQVDIGDRVTLTGGVRYDDLEGIDSLVSPRLAALWRFDERHALKAQYAQGFRSPHFIEMFRAGPPPPEGITFEKIGTLELAYVYRTPRTVFRATAFRSRIDDLIFPRDTPAFGRGFEIEAAGVELELTRQLAEWLKLVATVSRAETDDDRRTPGNSPVFMPGPSLGEVDGLANLALIARANAQWSFGLYWNHVGDRVGIGGDVPGYDLVNLGATWRSTRFPGLLLRLNARNLLDEEVLHVASLGLTRTVRHDYGGRHWGLSLEWSY